MFKAKSPNLTIRPAIARISEFICQALQGNQILAQSITRTGSDPALKKSFRNPLVPWRHHVEMMNKLSDPAARLCYLRATAQLDWSRSVLLNQIKAGAYERALKERKTHNFAFALPEQFAEQADEMLKSRYNLEFLGLGRAMKKRELEDHLVVRLQQFILELGYGFCFVGRQHRLDLGQKEYFGDLLFYNRFLKALVALPSTAR
jgi:predicted nuclease of restriction endonuclease-like (RecB) superfamily